MRGGRRQGRGQTGPGGARGLGDVARPAGALSSDELLGPGVVEGAGLHGCVTLQLLEGGRRG